jgi:aspartyl-tRNA(Asn)/glutamyl-tRNA(Gln) amidotransferase subunit A
MMDLARMSAVETAKAIKARKVSSEEATKAALSRLKAAHEALNIVVAFEDREALRAARAADEGLAARTLKGPLAGVPLAHKDMFDRAGKIASWGARIRSDKPAKDDATAIARLKSTGALQIAALHMTEFAFGPTGHNYVLGHARNPWDTSRIPGGSSSGTAAAVAVGAIPAGFGSDTGGSLRVPAACCNVASIKPTYTRVSRAGAMPLAPQLDTVGAIARHVEDLAVILQAIAGPDLRDPLASQLPVPDYVRLMEQPVKGLKIGIDEAVLGQAAADVQRAFEGTLGALSSLGMKAVRVRFPDWDQLDELAQLTQFPDCTAAHAQIMMTRGADYGPQVRARLEYGYFISATDHLTALRARGTMLARTLAETYAKADVTLLPILADPVPTLAALDVGGGPTLQAAMARIVRYTRPLNYLGLPTLALPSPRMGGLPCGFQLAGRPFAEGQLLAIGRAYQRVVPPEVAPLAA